MIKKKNEMGRSGTINERYEKSRMCPSLLCTIIFFGSLYIHAALKITKGFLILMKKNTNRVTDFMFCCLERSPE